MNSIPKMSEKKSSPIVNNEEIERIIQQLPKNDYLWNKSLYQWEGFWSNLAIIKAAQAFKATFKSEPNDILLASSMKTGSTWLKAICVSIMQGGKEEEEDLLVKDNPHFHVPTIEAMDYYSKTPTHDLYTMPSPRLFHTHLPYRVMPDSIKNSDNCKIIYITRNPKDTLISMWHFFNYNHKCLEDLSPLEEVVEYFCNGVHQYGPFFEHVLEYWEESKKRPQKMLFLKYEDLKIDPKKEVAKIALFLGKPFGNEEDLEIVLKKCSLERLKNLEVNKSGSIFSTVHNNAFFRKGIVGDWKNHMTPEMEEQLDKITKLKLQGSGLEFDTYKQEVLKTP
ncbi:cytosolic sulfotransferase 5-like [Solanum stenotomum]|uniref:cytosolic sulfotransferase 5-like n=1 Tax=Solanum stenotomum TaxID=172797 RepID=UPI0020D0CFBC|nr:cytosolic sulfotransferase 5-like [Solanum stenotomum]